MEKVSFKESGSLFGKLDFSKDRLQLSKKMG